MGSGSFIIIARLQEARNRRRCQDPRPSRLLSLEAFRPSPSFQSRSVEDFRSDCSPTRACNRRAVLVPLGFAGFSGCFDDAVDGLVESDQ
jgi:hypothetical protein